MDKKKLELLQKIKALADRGENGERDTAQATLDRLMTQYGITQDQLNEETRKREWFRYKNDYDKRLLAQIIYTVTGELAKAGCGAVSGRKRKLLGIDCTTAERIEIGYLYDFYKTKLDSEIQIFINAFVNKNNIFPPKEKSRQDIEPINEDLEQYEKMLAMMNGIDMHTPRKALENGL